MIKPDAVREHLQRERPVTRDRLRYSVGHLSPRMQDMALAIYEQAFIDGASWRQERAEVEPR